MKEMISSLMEILRTIKSILNFFCSFGSEETKNEFQAMLDKASAELERINGQRSQQIGVAASRLALTNKAWDSLFTMEELWPEYLDKVIADGATALIEAGYGPELEPQLNGNRLDAVILAGAERVYVEVISPELSQAMQSAEEGIGILACALTACKPGSITDVHLIADPDEDVIRQLLAFVLSTQWPWLVMRSPGQPLLTYDRLTRGLN